MALTISNLGPCALELDIRGRLELEDYQRFVPVAEERIKKYGKINLLVHITHLRGWSPAALWQDLKFDVKHYGDVSRLALVSADADKSWLHNLAKPFTAAHVESFPEGELSAGRLWVTGVKPEVPRTEE